MTIAEKMNVVAQAISEDFARREQFTQATADEFSVLFQEQFGEDNLYRLSQSDSD